MANAEHLQGFCALELKDFTPLLAMAASLERQGMAARAKARESCREVARHNSRQMPTAIPASFAMAPNTIAEHLPNRIAPPKLCRKVAPGGEIRPRFDQNWPM